MKICRVLVPAFALNLIALTAAFAQRAVPPPPKPADSGPSLAATMQFIQDKLNDLGPVAFVSSVTTMPNQSVTTHTVMFELSKVQADPRTCALKYHYKRTLDGKKPGEVDIILWVKEMESIQLGPLEQTLSRENASQGHPEWVVTSTQPQTLVLTPSFKAKLSFWSGWARFNFQDANLADRVAKAMVHAVELCGGGNKDPF